MNDVKQVLDIIYLMTIIKSVGQRNTSCAFNLFNMKHTEADSLRSIIVIQCSKGGIVKWQR